MSLLNEMICAENICLSLSPTFFSSSLSLPLYCLSLPLSFLSLLNDEENNNDYNHKVEFMDHRDSVVDRWMERTRGIGVKQKSNGIIHLERNFFIPLSVSLHSFINNFSILFYPTFISSQTLNSKKS